MRGGPGDGMRYRVEVGDIVEVQVGSCEYEGEVTASDDREVELTSADYVQIVLWGSIDAITINHKGVSE